MTSAHSPDVTIVAGSLQERMKVTGILIQGAGGDGVDNHNWVEKFVILVTNNPVHGKWDRIGLYTTTATELGTALPEVRIFNQHFESILVSKYEIHTKKRKEKQQ